MDIKAKKISQLTKLDIEAEKQRYLNSYLLIAYNNGIDDRANYKVKVEDLISTSYGSGIDESVLDNYATSAYVDNNYLSKNSWQNYYTYIMNTIADNMCDCDQNQGKFNEIWEAIQDIKDLIAYYHNKAIIKIDNLEHCHLENNPGFISFNTGEETITIVPDNGYKLQNDDVRVVGCEFDLTINSNGTGSLHLFNATSEEVNISIVCIAKQFNIIYNINEANAVTITVKPTTIHTGETMSATFSYDHENYRILNCNVSNTSSVSKTDDATSGIYTVRFKSNGNGNVVINLNLESKNIYYFGFIDSERLFELGEISDGQYAGSTYPIALLSVNGLKSAINNIPWTVDQEVVAVDYEVGNNYRYMIIPQDMFSIDNCSIEYNNIKYDIINANTQWSIDINNPTLFNPETNISGKVFDIGIYEKNNYYAILVDDNLGIDKPNYIITLK